MRRAASTTALPEAMVTSAALSLLIISSAVCFLFGMFHSPFSPESYHPFWIDFRGPGLSLLYDNVRVNCSGKMSVYEGRDIEPTRTGKTPSAQQRDGISTSRAQAAELLGISERQVRRILAAYRRDGAAALVHGNRGRKPRNSVPEDVVATTVILASENTSASTTAT